MKTGPLGVRSPADRIRVDTGDLVPAPEPQVPATETDNAPMTVSVNPPTERSPQAESGSAAAPVNRPSRLRRTLRYLLAALFPGMLARLHGA